VVEPVGSDLVDIGEAAGVPRGVGAWRGNGIGIAIGVVIVWVFADTQVGLADVPGQAQGDGFGVAGFKGERDEEGGAGGGIAFGDGGAVVGLALFDVFPGHGE